MLHRTRYLLICQQTAVIMRSGPVLRSSVSWRGRAVRVRRAQQENDFLVRPGSSGIPRSAPHFISLLRIRRLVVNEPKLEGGEIHHQKANPNVEAHRGSVEEAK